MKTIITIALISFPALQSLARFIINNTQWKGEIVRQGTSRAVRMDFKSDTFYVYRNSEMLSSFDFIQTNDTVTLYKTGGTGPCSMNSKGVYLLEFSENGEKFSHCQYDI